MTFARHKESVLPVLKLHVPNCTQNKGPRLLALKNPFFLASRNVFCCLRSFNHDVQTTHIRRDVTRLRRLCRLLWPDGGSIAALNVTASVTFNASYTKRPTSARTRKRTREKFQWSIPSMLPLANKPTAQYLLPNDPYTTDMTCVVPCIVSIQRATKFPSPKGNQRDLY